MLTRSSSIWLGMLVALLLATATLPACSARSGGEPARQEAYQSIERPAASLGEEEGVFEKAGQAMVATLVVCVALAAIVLPILLFV